MKCSNIQELLPLYIENELDDSIQMNIKNHLEYCKSCRSILNEFHETNSFLKSAPLPPVPSSFSLKWENEIRLNSSPKTRKVLYSILSIAILICTIFMITKSYFYLKGVSSKSPYPVVNDYHVASLGNPAIIKLKINSEKKQNISFKIKLSDEIRFLGTGLKYEENPIMSWDESINKGTKDIFVPVIPIKKGKSQVRIIIKNGTLKIEKSLNFNIKPMLVSKNFTAPSTFTVIF